MQHQQHRNSPIRTALQLRRTLKKKSKIDYPTSRYVSGRKIGTQCVFARIFAEYLMRVLETGGGWNVNLESWDVKCWEGDGDFFEGCGGDDCFLFILVRVEKDTEKMHRPGIEPGAHAWKASMLPLHHRC